MKQFKVALQLYSVRDEMERDMEGTLAKVKEMGYDYVEFAGYFGHSAEEVRAMLDRHGLECISVHQAPSLFLEEGQKAVDYLKTIGAKYAAIPWYGRENLKGSAQWDVTVKDFTAVAKLLKENGIQLMYHNHDFEFEKYEEKYLLDWIYDTIPADLLQPQIDTCWVRYAGEDPARYLLKYTGRISVLHLKDFVCKNLAGGPVYALIGEDGQEETQASNDDNGFEFRPVGHGMQDFPAILEAAEKAGVEYVVVEEDESPDRPAMEAAKASRDYLKSLGL